MSLFFSNSTRVDFVQRFYNLLERLVVAVENRRECKCFQVRMNFMPKVFKSDYPDFDLPITVETVDAEGNVVKGGKLPAGFSLTVVSSNPAALDIQPTADPLVFRGHVGGPTPEGDPSTATVTATLSDTQGVLLATDAEAVVVTAGDPATIRAINMVFPADVVDQEPAPDPNPVDPNANPQPVPTARRRQG